LDHLLSKETWKTLAHDRGTRLRGPVPQSRCRREATSARPDTASHAVSPRGFVQPACDAKQMIDRNGCLGSGDARPGMFRPTRAHRVRGGAGPRVLRRPLVGGQVSGALAPGGDLSQSGGWSHTRERTRAISFISGSGTRFIHNRGPFGSAWGSNHPMRGSLLRGRSVARRAGLSRTGAHGDAIAASDRPTGRDGVGSAWSSP
jgi:hypothetical protein